MKTALVDRVRRDQLADFLWQLVSTPSPTLQERRIAFQFAELLAEAGASVEVDESVPESPNVIGRLSGRGATTGPTLQLAGHLDHIDVPHPAPERTDEIISGRGSADMKNGLSGILEIVRILAGSVDEFAGEILVTAYGQHEAPLGNGATLRSLIDRKIFGDAAIVFEGPEDRVVVMGKGQSIWNVRLSRSGEVCHELRRPADADSLLEETSKVLNRLLAHRDRLVASPHDYPLLGPESIFVGQLHYGDFYNRVPTEATLQGTWRWHPSRGFADVKEELHNILSEQVLPEGVWMENWWYFVGEAFAFDTDEPVVSAIRKAYREVAGIDAEIAGSSTILDVNRLVPFAEIPAVGIGFDTERAHADYEYTHIDGVVRGCKIALQAVLNYLSTAVSE